MTGIDKSMWLKSVLPEGISCCEVTVPLHANPEITISYTDCHEVSLLRLLQMFLVDVNNPTTIDAELAKQKIQQGSPILDFLLKHPVIYSNRDFRRGSEVIQIRADWAWLMNGGDPRFFQYKWHGEAEFKANIENFVGFFRVFFPQIEYNHSSGVEAYLNNIFAYFSRPELMAECRLESTSRKDDTTDESVDAVDTYSKLFLHFNGEPCFEWTISQRFENGVRVTGHSQIATIRQLEDELPGCSNTTTTVAAATQNINWNVCESETVRSDSKEENEQEWLLSVFCPSEGEEETIDRGY